MPRLFSRPGRRLDRGGYLEYVGETGYYWSSSTGPNTATAQGSIVKSVWSVEIAGWNPGHLHILPTFGYSIRCEREMSSSSYESDEVWNIDIIYVVIIFFGVFDKRG